MLLYDVGNFVNLLTANRAFFYPASLVAGAAPAISPALSPSAGTNELAPAPVAGVSGSAALAVSIGSLIVALVAASFSFM
ncbi:unnamed protein product [Camellia sinensis]